MEDLKFTYKQYMDKECSCKEYYEQFITKETIPTILRVIGKKKILNSTDKYFNDIPLNLWDSLHPYLPRNWKLIRQTGEVNTGAINNTICIAKVAAEVWKNEQST